MASVVRRVHLVRHGEVENPTGVVYGALPGFGLSARGRDQVQAAARHLRGALGSPVLVLSSPLQRAQETAAIVAAELGDGMLEAVLTEAGLTEAGALLEGLPRRFAPLSAALRLLDAEARERSESGRQVLLRMHAAVEAAAARAPGADLVLVSHQVPIRMAIVAFEHRHALARRVPALFVRRPCAPASVTTLTWRSADDAVEVGYWAPT